MNSFVKWSDDTPNFWREYGGLHITLDVGITASAIRGTKEEKWEIFAPDNTQSTLSADTTESAVRKLLTVLVRRALLAALTELEKD